MDVNIDELVAQRKALKRKAEESIGLPGKKSAVQQVGQQPAGSSSTACSSSASGSQGQSSSGAGRGVAAAAPAPAPVPVSAPQHAFTEEQIIVIQAFSKPNLLAAAKKLSIQNVDAKTGVASLRVRIDRLFGRFTNLAIDKSKGTIEFDEFEEQHFQQPAA